MINDEQEDGIINCPLPKPALPINASKNAYYKCNTKTGEWEYYDPWLAKTFGEAFILSTKDGKKFTLKS